MRMKRIREGGGDRGLHWMIGSWVLRAVGVVGGECLLLLLLALIWRLAGRLLACFVRPSRGSSVRGPLPLRRPRRRCLARRRFVPVVHPQQPPSVRCSARFSARRCYSLTWLPILPPLTRRSAVVLQTASPTPTTHTPALTPSSAQGPLRQPQQS